jgi:class 3 adenylate cyclase
MQETEHSDLLAEVERLKGELKFARRQFTDAVMSTQEGFVVFDKDSRLVLCNETYRNFYLDAAGQDVADLVAPGAYQLDFLAAAFEAGMFPDIQGTTEEYIELRRQRQKELRRAVEIRFSGGVWVQVNERPTHDGGFVAVYTDITQLKRREAELAEKSNALERLSNQLAKYLSPQVYESIFSGRQEGKVASSRKKLTVFFSDIADFTETADQLESEALTQLLNHYLTEMSAIALEYGATIDKFVGDAIMIFFGDPESKGIGEDALACVAMAIAMRDRMVELQRYWRDSGVEKPLRCRMGIHTDYCTVGNFGSDDRMDYTIIGGGVNLASRLEAASTPGEILISYETQAHIKDRILCEETGRIEVKGLAYPIATYRVMDFIDRLDNADRPIRADLPHLQLNLEAAAMSAEEQRAAAEILSKALKTLSGD